MGLWLGASEEQTESYMEYGEGALELATTPEAKSASGILSFAQKQAGVVYLLAPLNGFGSFFYKRFKWINVFKQAEKPNQECNHYRRADYATNTSNNPKQKLGFICLATL